MSFDPREPGTVCRFDLSRYDIRKDFDAIVLSLGAASKEHLVKCLILGFENADYEARPGETVELPRVELKPFKP